MRRRGAAFVATAIVTALVATVVSAIAARTITAITHNRAQSINMRSAETLCEMKMESIARYVEQIYGYYTNSKYGTSSYYSRLEPESRYAVGGDFPNGKTYYMEVTVSDEMTFSSSTDSRYADLTYKLVEVAVYDSETADTPLCALERPFYGDIVRTNASYSSDNSNGYISLGDGVILQWGKFTPKSSSLGSTLDVAFPVEFANAVGSLQIGQYISPSDSPSKRPSGNFGFTGYDTTGATFFVPEDAHSGYAHYYMAIGW